MAWVVGIGIFVILLMMYTRKMVILIAVVVATSVVVVGGWYGLQSYKAWQAQRLWAKVNMEVFHAESSCSVEKPLLVWITNKTGRQIDRVTFTLAGYREGYSLPLYRGSGYSSDYIMADGKGTELCWNLPPFVGEHPAIRYQHPPSGLRWKVEGVSGTVFQ